MSQPIEDYAVIGDLHTAALVGKDGSVDWLCLPHFDSPSCFSRLLGHASHGAWKIAPAGAPDAVLATRRWYRADSLVLETEFDTPTGTVRVTPEGSPALNHGFDVTPARLITGIITERGVCPATEDGLRAMWSLDRKR